MRMALIFGRQFISTASVLAFVLYLGKGSCQNIDCPNGIVDITAATGEIAYPESSSDYGVNETKCWRIQVPNVYEGIGIYYNKLDIEQCEKCNCDSLTFAYNDTDIGGPSGKWTEDKVCGRQTPSYLGFLRMMDGDPNKKIQVKELYVRFSSDGTVNHKGFNITFVAKIDSSDPQSFLNASDDETIEFSTRKFGIENYPTDYEEEWFLIAPAGRQIQITFEEFELEQSEKCNKAFVEIREAYFDDGPYRDEIEAEYGTILAEHLCGNSLPQKIESSGNMAWVKIKSDKNAATNFKGFKASFKAVGQSNNQPDKCCDCKCNSTNPTNRSAQGPLSTANPMILFLSISTLLLMTFQERLF